MKRTLFSLWSIVGAMLLGSIAGSLWIRGETTVAVLLLIGMGVLFVLGVLGYSREEQRREQNGLITPVEWWVKKILGTLWVFCAVFILLYLWGKDPMLALSGASACAVGNLIAAFFKRKHLVQS